MKPAKERGGFGAGGTKFLWCMAQIAALSSEQGRTPPSAALAMGWGPGLAPLVPFAPQHSYFEHRGAGEQPWGSLLIRPS